jgi:hypothetical protein
MRMGGGWWLISCRCVQYCVWTKRTSQNFPVLLFSSLNRCKILGMGLLCGMVRTMYDCGMSKFLTGGSGKVEKP